MEYVPHRELIMLLRTASLFLFESWRLSQASPEVSSSTCCLGAGEPCCKICVCLELCLAEAVLHFQLYPLCCRVCCPGKSSHKWRNPSGFRAPVSLRRVLYGGAEVNVTQHVSKHLFSHQRCFWRLLTGTSVQCWEAEGRWLRFILILQLG